MQPKMLQGVWIMQREQTCYDVIRLHFRHVSRKPIISVMKFIISSITLFFTCSSATRSCADVLIRSFNIISRSTAVKQSPGSLGLPPCQYHLYGYCRCPLSL